ncbi:metallopeptidase family protein [Paracoccus cavernae]|uniref:Metallopeptidase family protein n=1 Tax=Paracoccus cavernae TaxID=1571207 RepID=A0ABT8DDA7_9RHOB|nr:metallopeptidase family protein [Paracoccus cavernae]
MTDWTTSTAPDLAAIETLAREVIAGFPPELSGHAEMVVLRVEELASDEFLEELEIHDPLELTGLYDGIPMTEKSASEPQSFPDRVWLFRRAILDEWASRGDVTLGALVSNVVVHEFAHHFGWSDEDIATIDRWWE